MRERAWLEAEALFAGLSKTKEEPTEEVAAEAVTPRRRRTLQPEPEPAEEAGGRRRRIVGAGLPIKVVLDGSSVAPPAQVVDSRTEEARAQLAGAIRDLGGSDRGERLARRRDEEVRARSSGRVTRLHEVEALATHEKAPDLDAFLVAVRAPTVEAGGDLHFVVDGADVVDAAGDAMRGVEEYMAAEHPGCAWQMRSIERIRDVLRPAPKT